jgi:acyl transferase domain-containing protein/acyl carrier protein
MTDSPLMSLGKTNGREVEFSTTKRALLAMRDLRAELDTLRGNGNAPIAIVGMGCRFPGAPGLDAFWEMLRHHRDGVGEVPAERWDAARFFHSDSRTPGKIASRWGGFLDHLDRFDASFFGISPREAPHVDPRQRKVLEIAWEALEDAGIPPLSLAGSATGVYIATLSNDYDMVLCRNYGRISSATGPGTANSILANRLSYFLDLHGPSLTLDTACSGSLLTIELACRSLRAGESSLGIAGGVSINLLPKGDVFFSAAGALSPTGRCKTFDSEADGIVRSEGAGVVILKRMQDAIDDGDRIYAVIRGGAINHDGASNGIMAPNGEAQKRVLREAYRNAGIAPGAADYVEAHGTGTPLGDPIEISALAAIMGDGRNGTPLMLGSLKTNVGHMEAAAGVASVIKVALAMHNGVMPPNREFKTLNPRIPESSLALEVLSEPKDWPSNGRRRIAGVSAFSFGGTNAHLVLEEAPQVSPSASPLSDGQAFVLPISAKSPEALQASIDTYRQFLKNGAGGSSLSDVCFTASVRRSHHHHRFAAVASSAQEMAAQLNTAAPARREVSKLAFVFSGQGSHWQGMGEGLFTTEPVFRDALEKCDRLFREHTGWSVIEEIRSGVRLNQTDVSQTAIFSMQIALLALWRSWGIEPDAVVGQSLGEVAAAYAAGALSLESAVAVVHHRSRLMRTVAGQGRTAVVGLDPEAAREAIAAWDGELHVAGNSSPETSVVSGTSPAIAAMLSTLQQRGVFAQPIAGVDVAFHSPQMNALRGDLETSLQTIDCGHAKIAMMSTVTASWLNGNRPDADYWGRNLCEPFQLADAVGELINEGFDGFLEISPQSMLGGPIRQVLAHRNAEALVLGSSQRGEAGSHTMLASLAAFYAAGRSVSWSALFPAGGRCVSLPAYPWQREHYWLDQLPGGSTASRESGGAHPLLGEAIESALPGSHRLWEQDIDQNSPHYLSGHKVLGGVVFPGAGYVEAALAAMREANGESGVIEISGLRFHEGMPLSTESRRVQVGFSPNALGGYDFQFSAREPASSGWTRHASGTVSIADASASTIALEGFLQSDGELLAGQQHYEAMALQGLEYGGSFRAITTVLRTKGKALVELELDAAAAAEARDYCVHPILIDAALQAVAATIESGEGHVYSTESYLPRGVDRIRFYSSPGGQATCVAQLRSGQAGDPELRADLQLTDSEGRVCLEIEGLRLAHVSAAQTGARGKLRDWLYDLCWEESPRAASSEPANDPARTGPWIILADAGGFGLRLAEHLRERGLDSILVPPGDDEIENWLGEAGAGIVYLRGLDDLAANSEATCTFPLRLAQALAGSGKKEIPALWIVTRETQTAGGRTPVLTPAAQLWGFGKVLALEHPEMKGGIIDLGAPAEDLLQEVADELLSPDSERQLAFHQGKRFAARLRRSPDTSNDAPKPGPVVLRADATYLITGGLGGLGLSVAQWMVAHGARRFILAGRTPLPPRVEWLALPEDHPAKARVEAVRELERLGASVHLAVLDAADADELKAYVDGFHAEGWPSIRGVIHAAGVVEDQLMLRLDAETFAKVIHPKVAGAWALHEATKSLDLDFFTLFSSLSSVLGQFGQAHYAAGNAYMDHLAHWRRGQGLPATSINWGPWAEVGLFARIDATDKTGRSGVFPMLPEQALQAMERIHALSPAQAVVVSAEWGRMPPSPLLSELAPSGGAVERSAEQEQTAAALLLSLLLATPEERREALEEHLRIAAARVLGLDPARLDLKEPLTSFGMDSIMVVELKNHIERTMNLSISMVDLFTSSIAKLAEQVADKLADDKQIDELLTQVENMSPQEIAALLGGETGLTS